MTYSFYRFFDSVSSTVSKAKWNDNQTETLKAIGFDDDIFYSLNTANTKNYKDVLTDYVKQKILFEKMKEIYTVDDNNVNGERITHFTQSLIPL